MAFLDHILIKLLEINFCPMKLFLRKLYTNFHRRFDVILENHKHTIVTVYFSYCICAYKQWNKGTLSSKQCLQDSWIMFSHISAWYDDCCGLLYFVSLIATMHCTNVGLDDNVVSSITPKPKIEIYCLIADSVSLLNQTYKRVIH